MPSDSVATADLTAGTNQPGDGEQTTGQGGGLLTTSFLGLVATQFLVALNDNIFRWLLIPIGKTVVEQQKVILPGFTDPVGSDFVLSAGSACFLLPFLLLAAPAGYAADRFSKRSVMIGCKVAEIVIMTMGILVILSGNLYIMLLVLFLMGAQSAIFSPSKYSSIPELVRPDRISAANGVIGMTTMFAIIGGTVLGGYLFTWTTLADDQTILPGQHNWWISAVVLIGVAVLGWIASLFIGRLKPANPQRVFPRNPASQTVKDLAALIAKRPILLAALGSSYFWAVGALAQVNIDKFAQFELLVEQKYFGPLLGMLVLGIGIGAFVAGIWSAGKIELGIVPLGAAGMAIAAICISMVPPGTGEVLSSPYYCTCGWLLALGMAAGLYDIPLLAFMQENSPKQSRGRILAAYNFLAFSGMFLASGVFGVLAGTLGLSARQIWLIVGVFTIPVFVLIAWVVFTPMMRVLVGLATRLLYRVRIDGAENIPKQGGALLVANHVSWADGVLLFMNCPRRIRYVAYADYIDGRFLGRLARDTGAIPIVPGRKSMVRSLRNAREALKQGDVVCIFPEGALSRTGHIQGFTRGFLSVIKGTNVPVIPVHLGGLWGSIFSFERNKFFWKWPRRVPYPVSITFGPPIHNPTNAQQVRLAVQQLEVKSMEDNKDPKQIPPRAMLRNLRRNMRTPRIADSTGAELTGSAVLTRALVLRRLLRREVLAKDERHVGILMPPSVGGILTNAALALDGRVAVNLNYTVSSDIMNRCIDVAGIRHVLTSRKVMEKLGLKIDAEVIYLEDFKEKVTLVDKLAAASAAWIVPVGMLERTLGLTRLDPDDVMTIIFTSGSTGRPKGVMLTYDNIGSNVRGFSQMLRLDREDVLLGILPLFHSFGYTAILWSVLTLDSNGVYHYSPLEARQIGKLSGKYGATVLIGTPTFLRSYIKRCEPEDFAALEVVITGAEKLPPDVADAFEKKFGIRPLEGYGTTELSPVVSLNVPPSRVVSEFQQAPREGTVGQTIPGVSAKVVDLDTGEDLGIDRSGMLLIKGVNVMKGYLNQPQVTAEVIHDGWYTTGDVAQIDADGYIKITGRQSRFSKIGGEMVPHIGVEEILATVLSSGDDEDDDQVLLRVAVTSVPDAKKGERLIVLHTGLRESPQDVCRRLADEGLPPIWLPSPDSFYQVDEIPILGTGKLDLHRIKELALEKNPNR
jgi:acyl-[acyl-carrier-protein]-phospholipid O-acyltransferase / long-chain-fatty-acid--[acyl-carrier-protein] ligase